MRRDYDVIVLGCGGLGSGAAYWLARRAGADVLALEQFELGHVRGGSQDRSRIIRLTYHHADYTALTPLTYDAWATLEEESGVRVVHRTGSIEWADADSPHVADVHAYAAAMDAAAIPYDRLDADEVMARYPQFRLAGEVEALWQERSGIADAAAGNAAHVATARLHGATVLDRCPVLAVRPRDGAVDVETAAGTFTCRRLVVTAGAWTDRVLAPLGRTLRLTVTQEQVTYYATPHLREFAIGRFPIFICHDEEIVYGFPVYGEVATKASIDAAGAVTSPEARSFEPDPVYRAKIDAFIERTIPRFGGPKLYEKTCLYDMTPDRNFVVDVLPEHPEVIVVNGAAHAYKFASLLGRIAADLALDGATELPIAPFALDRPALTDPAYQAAFHL